VFLYAIAAIIDAILGLSILNQFESTLFRISSAAAVIAIYLYLTGRDKKMRPLPLISISLVLSIIAFAYGQRDWKVPVNVALKIAAVILTLKPEIIEVEIISENEEDEG